MFRNRLIFLLRATGGLSCSSHPQIFIVASLKFRNGAFQRLPNPFVNRSVVLELCYLLFKMYRCRYLYKLTCWQFTACTSFRISSTDTQSSHSVLYLMFDHSAAQNMYFICEWWTVPLVDWMRTAVHCSCLGIILPFFIYKEIDYNDSISHRQHDLLLLLLLTSSNVIS
jgi:hypothetical protein